MLAPMAEREQSFPTFGRIPAAFRNLSAAKLRIIPDNYSHIKLFLNFFQGEMVPDPFAPTGISFPFFLHFQQN